MNACQPVSSPWTSAMVILTALGAVVFVVSYAVTTGGRWRKNPLGWNVMAFMAAIAIVSCLAVATIIWGGDWPGREVIRPAAWGLIGVMIWWRVIILYRVQHQRHRNDVSSMASEPLERPWLPGQLTRVDDLVALEEGWSGERSLPSTEAAAVAARALLHTISALHTVRPKMRPQLVPTADGGIQIVWREQGYELDVDIEPGGQIAGWLHRLSDDAEMTWPSEPSDGSTSP